MDKEKKNVGLLSACQGLLLTNNSILIATNDLVGYALASDKTWATLPVTAYIVGAAVTTMPASLLMRRYGRSAGLMLGAVLGIVGAISTGLGYCDAMAGGTPAAGAKFFITI